MSRFDVYGRRDGEAGYLLDCQADLLSGLTTRLVVPLLPEADAPHAASRLNPKFMIGGDSVVMVTQYATAIPVSELGDRVAALRDRHDEIIAAIDFLVSGF
jgi:toxin CcdB